jgi:hypothetical protein
MGASARQLDLLHSIVAGAPGGDGGHIRVSFPTGRPGAVRFRGVAFLTGSGAGSLRTEVPLVFFPFHAPIVSPLVVPTGGAGGKGSTGDLTGFTRNPVGDQYFGPLGGDGGAGGAAGTVFVDPAARVLPAPAAGCTRSAELRGHDGGVPKDAPATPIGTIQTTCATVDGSTLDLLTLFLEGEADADGNVCGPGGGGQCAHRMLGGSGGLAGGSVLNSRNDPGEFQAEGTAGRMGALGEGGTLTLPAALAGALR